MKYSKNFNKVKNKNAVDKETLNLNQLIKLNPF